ncbi:zinc transporter ZupT [Tissierella sp. MB52-C2]|uniref:zinc transporter ZupT n=1 Tax=Tissierella sp. MB52-C2 TaxID=3070999 RepID=UPI00280AD9CF|nr:zinc transporter ZupT [Tissierella sp. MB52-C2]WMM24444.1 zinc transporter ZupT [Tissierella sp. MB52-C2]
MNKAAILSLGLTTIVGLSMGVGSLLSFFIKETNKRFLAIALSFSAGIMIYVSFMAMLPESMELIESYFGDRRGHLIALMGFFGGMLITAAVEKLVHKFGGHYHGHGNHHHGPNDEHLSKLGIMSAVAIAIHNLPEGLAIFTAGLKDISVAVPIAAAVILHNIPLSIAISVPIYYSTGSKKKAFLYPLFVGLCQPLGAIIGYLILSQFFNDLVFGILFSIVGGIMIFVSLDELLPSSQRYENHHVSVYGAIAGMIVMALSMSIFHHH